VVKRAEDAGIETSVIVSLAARLKPSQKLDFAQAVVEVSHAVDIAMNVVVEGSSGSSDQLVDEVLKRIAAKTKANDPAGATREAEDGFARWEKQEADRRANATATGVALLEAALKTDLLRFDAVAGAERVEKIASIQHENDPKALFDAVRARYEEFSVEGQGKGVNFSLDVAISIARREVALAQSPGQHGAALTDLGQALLRLGMVESGTAHVEEAVATYRAALAERVREQAPLDWADAQNRLGNALVKLGDREIGTAHLEEAVPAYLAALSERTHERFPLDWAATEANLGVVLAMLGEREIGTARLEDAVKALRMVQEEYTHERFPAVWADTQTFIGNALVAIGERESGTAALEAAVVTYRAAIKEYTPERSPVAWAGTHYDLGTALYELGDRESGTARLEEAVAAFQASLDQYTRERFPLDWAASFGGQGAAMVLIADRTNDGALAETSVTQIELAYRTLRDGGQQRWAALFQGRLVEAEAIRDRLKGK
jgi:tetratricopeptide (TPR) repeat protein